LKKVYPRKIAFIKKYAEEEIIPTNGDCKNVKFRSIASIIKPDIDVKTNLLFTNTNFFCITGSHRIFNFAHLIYNIYISLFSELILDEYLIG
jgi:hypothetical protein